MNFGEALESCKIGMKIQREGWNGKGMWVMIQKPDKNSKMTLPYLYMKTVDGEFVPWLISQTDALADDWNILLQEEQK